MVYSCLSAYAMLQDTLNDKLVQKSKIDQI